MIAWTTPLTLSLDEQRFWDLAGTRMTGTAFVPPLMPWFLAAARALFGDSVTATRIAVACLSVIAIVLVHVLAQRHLGAGRPSAWLAALSPTLVYYDGRLRSEPLVILALLSFALLWSLPQSRRAWAVPGAGLSLGLAALARPEFLLLPAVLALVGLARRTRPSLRDLGILVVGMILPIVPWTLRNHHEVGAWVVVSSNGGYNFWKSFNGETDGSQDTPLDYSIWDKVPEKRADAFGYGEGWRFVRDHPLRSLALAPLKIGHLFGPERDYLSDLKRAAFPRRLWPADAVLVLGQNAAWLLLLAAGSSGLIGPRRTAVKDAALAVLATLVLVHLVFFGDDRFHVPLVPFLCIASVDLWRERAAFVRGPAARALGAALFGEIAFWGAVLLRDAPKIAELWKGL